MWTMSHPRPQRENFAQRLVRIRKAKGLTQVELARASGISPRMIAHYETRIQNPAPATVLRLTKVLRVSVDDLFGNTPFPKLDIPRSRKLFKKLKAVEGLPLHAQKTVIDLIDGLEAKHKAKQAP
jgi:transcriptional regulator with XRE-family HTH domain